MKEKLVTDGDGNLHWVSADRAKVPGRAVPKPVEGEALGCIATQVDEMRAFAKSSGFTDIEYVEDPDIKGFYNCRAPNAERFNKFSEACQIPVKNGQYSGKTITKDELESAKRLITAKYPKADPRRAG